MLEYVKGDATNPPRIGTRVICHICNDIGAWGAGFALALGERYPKAKRFYQHCHERYGLELGQIQVVHIEPHLYVVNMIAQHKLRSKANPHPIRYDALRDCLTQLTHRLLRSDLVGSFVIDMPRIGCGLAGGEWDMVEPIVSSTVGEYFVVKVYDV